MLSPPDRYVVRSREAAYADFPHAPKASFVSYAAAAHAASVYNKLDVQAIVEAGGKGFTPTVDTRDPFIVIDTQPTCQLNQPEPPPRRTEGRPIWELVIEDATERDRAGRAKYGTPLQAFNGRRPLVDAYQESLDLVVYLRQAIEEGRQLYPMPHHALEFAQTLWHFSTSCKPAEVGGWNHLNDQAREQFTAAIMQALIELEQRLPADRRGVSGIYNDAQLAAALKNVGVDLGCEVCASIFYTGSSSPAPHTCQLATSHPRPLLDIVTAMAAKAFCNGTQWIQAAIPGRGPADTFIRVASDGRLEWRWCESSYRSWRPIEVWSEAIAHAPCQLISAIEAAPHLSQRA